MRGGGSNRGVGTVCFCAGILACQNRHASAGWHLSRAWACLFESDPSVRWGDGWDGVVEVRPPARRTRRSRVLWTGFVGPAGQERAP